MEQDPKIEDHSLADEPMVSYVHPMDPKTTFVQYAKDPVPPWAVDVREVKEEKK